ncbi:MAG: acyl-CoA thioesterase/bile acid-CoA:amino acid N-acyltransferase family protein [Thermomicrobiales bacterium]
MSRTGNETAAPRFEGFPAESLADEAVHVRLTGIEPGARATVRSRLRDDLGNWWEAANAFRADEGGAVDLTTAALASGSYEGAEPMGFLWSMTPAGPPPHSTFWPTSLEPKTVELAAEADGQTVAEARLVRRYLAPGVRRIEVRDDGLFGAAFFPAGDGPFPAILLLTGSGGGLSEPAAALYAAHGIGALALAYFRAGDLPAELVRIPLEYFARAIAWLQARPEIDPDRLAVGGASRGGELSLLLGSRFPQFKAVVANVPSGIVFGGVGDTEAAYRQPAWTHCGEDVTFLFSRSRSRRNEEGNPDDGTPFALTPGFLRTLEEEAALAREAAIPVERINGPVLLISGREDAMWPSTHFSELVMARLAEHRHPYPDRHLAYDGAGHMIGPPWVPTTVSASVHPVSRRLFAYGGTAKGSAAARADSWPKILAFLDERLKGMGD